MVVVKAIYMVILILYTITKIADNAIKASSTKERIITLIEMIIGIILTFVVYKI